MSNLQLKNSPTLNDIQEYVRAMVVERGFAKETPQDNCLLLIEELGELAKCIRKQHASMRIDSSKTYDFDIEGEIADIMIVLTCLANQLGIDMEQAFRVKEEKNKQRTWL
jgi:NTP pyrophosphatase (non-canonical NTP hydrolase)